MYYLQTVVSYNEYKLGFSNSVRVCMSQRVGISHFISKTVSDALL